ncbi:hypothetical protein B0T19DRAFT_403581 [Cercophora scortea]|uniref:Uncharacterized protein n=1 Tax=Cercophora scortea TaxID=314031 RepID=A0AAE0M688_9PEZI|nr:hypothetical protein B0T19DRAFT_403581 [Cercophora scortea]
MCLYVILKKRMGNVASFGITVLMNLGVIQSLCGLPWARWEHNKNWDYSDNGRGLGSKWAAAHQSRWYRSDPSHVSKLKLSMFYGNAPASLARIHPVWLTFELADGAQSLNTIDTPFAVVGNSGPRRHFVVLTPQSMNCPT